MTNSIPPFSRLAAASAFDYGPSATAPATSRVRPLAELVEATIRPGDTVHYPWLSTRACASIFEVVRQARCGRLHGLTIISTSLRAETALLITSGAARRFVTSFAASTYPSIRANTILRDAVTAGTIELEEWSLLAIIERTLAAAMGWPFVVADTLSETSLPSGAGGGVATLADPFTGTQAAVMPPLASDVTLIHCPLADWEGNGVLLPPFAEDIYSAYAARRGVLLTAERIVSPTELRRWAHHVRVPAACVAGVAAVPFGAHPAAQAMPVGLDGTVGYGEDYAFLTELGRLRDAADAEAFCRRWIDTADREGYLAQLGPERIEHLVAMEMRGSWQIDAMASGSALDTSGPAEPPSSAGQPSVGERLAVSGARATCMRARSTAARTVLAGAGVSSLAAALARVALLDEQQYIDLVFESGVVGYVPRPYDSTLSNTRNLPTARQLSGSLETLGMLMRATGGTLAVLSAGMVDTLGNANSNRSWTGEFLVGGGGSTDIARATSTIAVLPADVRRFVQTVEFVTYHGANLDVIATDRWQLRRTSDGYMLSAWFADLWADADAALADVRERTGWDVKVAEDVVRLDPPSATELDFLRALDPDRNLLG